MQNIKREKVNTQKNSQSTVVRDTGHCGVSLNKTHAVITSIQLTLHIMSNSDYSRIKVHTHASLLHRLQQNLNSFWKGKQSAQEAWNGNPAFIYTSTHPHAALTKDAQDFQLLECFTVILYDKTSIWNL